MKPRNFRGGVHPSYNKHWTADQPIEVLPAPDEVIIPMAQHVGKAAEPLVKKGDYVKVGQIIGKICDAVCASVHSSVSGTVKAVEPRPTINGHSLLSVVIENDGKDETVEISGHPDPIQLSALEIQKRIEAAGIVGLGGAGFPTIVKLSSASNHKIDYLIINGSECEPYLTADHRIMVEYTDEVILGAKLLAKASGAEKIIIAIEENKPECIKKLTEAAGSGAIEVVPVVTKYPAGGEKQLIEAVCNRQVPFNGRPYNVGVVVQNVGTAWAVAQACLNGRPLIERVVTIAGDVVKEPGNFMVRIGTPFAKVIEAAGGFSDQPAKVLSGGPMMGLTQYNLEVPVVKGVAGILAFSKNMVKQHDPMPCIKCSRCVDVCPVSLMPIRIELFAINGMWDEAREYGAMDCIECGSCTYICPSKRGLYHWIKLAKNEISLVRLDQSS